jgi:hydroxypyruvate reductase
MDPQSLLTATLRAHRYGGDVASLLGAAITAADPAVAVRRYLRRSGDEVAIGDRRYELEHFERVLLLAVGKAAVPMAHAALDVLGDRIAGGLVVPKATGDQPPPPAGALPVIPSAHPVPDERSLHAGARAVELLESAGERDLVVVLLSGGGSALITMPEDGLTLAGMRGLTDALLRSGATINEINALRRRCDRVKGGGLLRAAAPATVAVLVLSDVLGDDLQAIASGPFVAGPERIDARTVIDRYHLRARLDDAVLRLIDRPRPAPPEQMLARVHHTIVANIDAAVAAAADAARERGWTTQILATALQGEARDIGRDLAGRLAATRDLSRPLCLLAGGETTVTLHGDGWGGRNQELALGAVETLAGRSDLLLVALATDGGDGPTDAAGAVTGGETLARGRDLGLEPQDFLRRNDSYHYFEPLGDLLKPGPTETNVNDLVLLCAF